MCIMTTRLLNVTVSPFVTSANDGSSVLSCKSQWKVFALRTKPGPCCPYKAASVQTPAAAGSGPLMVCQGDAECLEVKSVCVYTEGSLGILIPDTL